jgi:hypothetical protein
VRWLPTLCALAFGACGFQNVETPDQAVPDLAGADDLAGVDAPTGDLADVTSDDAAPGPDLGSYTGAGPLGALPTGYCCVDDTDCRGRHCIQTGGGAFYCSDYCFNGSCTQYNAGFACAMPQDNCVSMFTPSQCVSASLFHPGVKPFGACCNADTDCESGWCITTGNVQNPKYCSMACNASTDCPTGNVCVTEPPYFTNWHNCQNDLALHDSTVRYTCF